MNISPFEVDGAVIRLQRGDTFYQFSGPNDRSATVLVHGFSVPSFIWTPTVEALNEVGRTTLRYDLYGRGLSDRPAMDYTLDIFVEQLHELIDNLSVPLPVNLIGLSMGAPICAQFIDKYPAYVNKLILIAPLVSQKAINPVINKLITIKPVHKLLIKILPKKFVIKSVIKRLNMNNSVVEKEFFQLFYRQTQIPGYWDALISTLQGGMIRDFSEIYKRIDNKINSGLLIWGCEDSIVDYSYHKELIKLMPDLQFKSISNAGHLPHYEYPHEVNEMIIEFLR